MTGLLDFIVILRCSLKLRGCQSRLKRKNVSRYESNTFTSICAALSTSGGRIAVALTLVVVAVIASIFHVNWSERIATAGLVILISLLGSSSKRGI